jgi:hypothetical protein
MGWLWVLYNDFNGDMMYGILVGIEMVYYSNIWYMDGNIVVICMGLNGDMYLQYIYIHSSDNRQSW